MKNRRRRPDQTRLHRKVFVSLKEARETRYWLRLIAACRPPLVSNVAPLIAECEQLVAILTVILRNARTTPDRGK
jgi:four helix bundle protein